MIPIAEIYGPVIQGEGPVIGTPTVFVRVGGCDYRCEWCDSLHAVDPINKPSWIKSTPTQIVDQVCHLTAKGGACMVTLSGGNPALYDELAVVIDELATLGYRTACETQGSKIAPWFADLDVLVLSPKPPSSGHVTTVDEVRACIKAARPADRMVNDMPIVAIKVVVFDAVDLEYLALMRETFLGEAIFAQVGNPAPFAHSTPDPAALIAAYRALEQEVIGRGWYDVRALPQLHTLAYGNARGT
jgi:7-carboxy-7-deazaguanine synthase